MKLLLILALMTQACGMAPYKGSGWDPSLNEKMNDFMDKAAKAGISIDSSLISGLTIVITVAPDGEAGQCKVFDNYNRRDITLNTKDWNEANDAGKKATLWHELGHCLLGYKHRGQTDAATGEPTSLMWPVAIESNWAEKNEAAYEKEFWL